MERLQKIKEDFYVTELQAAHIAELFKLTISAGLSGQKTSLKMLPSFLTVPTGQERGSYLALDFGGTNVRVMEVELLGGGEIKVQGLRSSPLRHPQGLFDYTSEQTTARELFDFIAGLIGEMVKPGETYALGHTFSFPIRQKDVNNAVLLSWTKEIRTRDVEGGNVTEILSGALRRKGLINVVPQVVINDTVGSLLAAAYQQRGIVIGSVCGTGHNTAYLEPNAGDQGEMIINLEAGNFDLIPGTRYDEILDGLSESPGSQRLEKMVSGRYLGELTRLILADLTEYGLFNSSANAHQALAVPELLDGEDLARILNDECPDLSGIAGLGQQKMHLEKILPEERKAIREIARMVAIRSAQLVAATYRGILQHIDPGLRHTHIIAIDGALFEKMPGYAAAIRAVLDQGLGAKAGMVRTILSKSGSGIGAAVAVAVAGNRKKQTASMEASFTV
jgi:hexokinase